MEIRKGIAASYGYAIGEAFVLEAQEFRIPRKSILPQEAESEVKRFQAALALARKEHEETVGKVPKKVGDTVLSIVRSHLLLLSDPSMAAEIQQAISKSLYSAEYAVSHVIRRKLKALESWGDTAMASRLEPDYLDLEKSLHRALLGKSRQDVKRFQGKVVLVAHDLTPAQTASLDRENTLGILTDKGGKTSHTSLVAASLGIPAIVGLGTITREVSGGDTLIVDGSTGTVIINPDEGTLKRYQAMQKNYSMVDRRLTEKFRGARAETQDGVRVAMYANIEFPDEVPMALEYGAEGIGLFRTEYLFLNRPGCPEEKEHMDAYLKGVRASGDRPFTIRTLDLGADKLPVNGLGPQGNPFLGVRAIRLCLERMELLVTQLRAILRISHAGSVRIMLPMISTLGEVLQVKDVLEECKRRLRGEGVMFQEKIPLGVMIEVPAAAIAIDQIIEHVDFCSIGTNDLVAFLMAVDRTNERVANLYQPGHPAVVRVLKMVIDAADRAKKPVSVCGEMAGDILYAPLLLGLGLRIFSVVPHMIPEIKRVLGAFTRAEHAAMADEVLKMQDGRVAEEFLRERVKERLPELL